MTNVDDGNDSPGDDTRRPKKTWEWMAAIRESDLPSTTRLLAWTLFAFMEVNGDNCYPSVGRLAREMGVSKPHTVHEHLRRLVEGGWLRVESKGGRAPGRGGSGMTNLYLPMIPCKAAMPSKGGVDAGETVPSDEPSPAVSQPATMPVHGAQLCRQTADDQTRDQTREQTTERNLAPIGDLARDRKHARSGMSNCLARVERQRKRERTPIEGEVLLQVDAATVADWEDHLARRALIGRLRDDPNADPTADREVFGSLFVWLEDEARACNQDLTDAEFECIMHAIETEWGTGLAEALHSTPEQSTWNSTRVGNPLEFFQGRFRKQVEQGRQAAA